MNEVDLGRLADRLRRCADVLERDGLSALRTAADWKGPLAATPYAPAGTGRTMLIDDERCAATAVEAAALEPQTVDQLRQARLVSAIGVVDIGVASLTRLILSTAPQTRIAPKDDGPGDMWCHSCHRDNKHCQPIAERFASKRECNFCGSFRQTYKRLPPLSILDAHHQGRRITTADVMRALAQERAEEKARKRKKAS